MNNNLYTSTMPFKMPTLRNFFSRWERDKSGQQWSFIEDINDWSEFGKNNIDVALHHPILTPALQFVSKIFSQADFYIEDKQTKERNYDHPDLKILNSPNYYQTQNDFLEALMFTQIAAGLAIVWKRKVSGIDETESMYLLNPYLLKYPSDFVTKLSIRNSTNSIRNVRVIYDPDGENHSIPIRDLMFFYDLPNGIDTKNMFKNGSRIDGLKQTLINTKDSLKAKNIILKTNGKELITGKAGSVQLSPEEKQDAQDLFNNNFGLGVGRSRSLVTKADLNYKSLHIALRDLGLDESVKVDGNLIYTALHIPKDILSLEAKKTTYSNFKESMVSYLQNEMQSSLDAFTAVLNSTRDDTRYVVKGTYEHLPIMQYILKERYEGQKVRAEALKAFLDAGMPPEIALDLLGLDKTIKLEKPVVAETDTNDNSTSEEDKQFRNKLKIS